MNEDIQAHQEDVSHGLLLAVLMKLGGSIDLDREDVQPEVMGGPAGEFFAVQMAPQPGGGLRLSVVPRPTTPKAGR